MNRFYSDIAARAENRCEYCRAPEYVFNFPFEVEHIVPVSRGGLDEPSNLALACRSCNLCKSNFTSGIDPATELETPLFNPRQDRWSEHFDLDPNAGKILGKTAVGRATIQRLRMNSSAQVNARKVWIQLQLFP